MVRPCKGLRLPRVERVCARSAGVCVCATTYSVVGALRGRWALHIHFLPLVGERVKAVQVLPRALAHGLACGVRGQASHGMLRVLRGSSLLKCCKGAPTHPSALRR